jgi:predicted Zn-dependent protease
VEHAVRRALILLYALSAGMATATASDDNAWPAADLALIHSARLWEIHDRGDLAQLALQKLIAARPDSPQAMVELGELDIRIGELSGAAQVLMQMQQRFKDSAAARDFEIEYHLATRDRLQLASVRRLIQMGKAREARAALRALFPNGAPGNWMGAEYYRVLARTPDGWSVALQGLKHLAAQHPDDPNYQLALARQMLDRPQYAVEGIMILYRLAQRDDIRIGDIDQLLAEAFREVSARHIPTLVLRDYLKRHPDDAPTLAILAQQRRAIEQGRLLVSGGLAKIEPALQRQLIIQALSASLEQRAQDTAAARALLLMRMLDFDSQREPLPLDTQLDDAVLEAARWYQRGQRASMAGQPEVAAAEWQAALAFHDRNYEAVIASAEELDSLRRPSEGGALLASAGRLDPRSNWLFETRVRRLIAHHAANEALALLQQHALNRKWTAASRDALMAAAFDRRGSDRAAAGDADGAIADLQAAVELSPQDPWMRYRLAQSYQAHGSPERGVAIMNDGVRLAPDDPQMRFAQALYLSELERYEDALAAIDAIDPAARSSSMINLHDRLHVVQARARARELNAAGDTAGARAALLAVEAIAMSSLDRARELAYAWLELGDPEHAIALLQPYRNKPDGAIELARLQRALDMRELRALERDGQYQDAQRKLDALLAADPQDRTLRVARAELDLTMGRPHQARDRLAALVAEQPDDFDARLSYVRALTESGDLALARVQLLAIQDHLPADDSELQLSLARRQLALGDANNALSTLHPLLERTPARADVLLLAARAELELHHFALARAYFAQAERASTATDALVARRSAGEIDARLQSSVATALQVLHQPGVSGISQLDVATIPSSWVFAHGYEQRFIAHADIVSLETGHLGEDFDHAALLGKVQAAGPDAPLHFSNDRQTGVAVSAGRQTDTLAADVGTTPLGFILPNIVGGVEWTPSWKTLDLSVGLARRALTSSALSYAGLRDPISGQKWGGVVSNGPYAGVGLYRERFSLSGSLRFSELTGTHVEDNQFLGARASGSWKFFSSGDVASAYSGLVLNDWNYQHNLSNYTFGSGGYYSPHSYVSAALPLELTGVKAGWSYQLRASLAYSISDIAPSNFYPNDPALQMAAGHSPLPSGFDSPVFSSSHGGAFSVSAYAAIERQVARGLVLGAMLDIDRTDFYHPTVISLYLRHSFTPFETALASPPRPTRPYNQ